MEQEVYAIALQWLRDEEVNQSKFRHSGAGIPYDDAGFRNGCPDFSNRGRN